MTDAKDDSTLDITKIDPIFGEPIGTRKAQTTSANKDVEAISPGLATILGAGVGAVTPNMEPSPSRVPGLTQARVNVPVTQQGLKSTQEELMKQYAAHDAKLADLQKLLPGLQTNHSQNMAEYQALRDAAVRAGMPVTASEGMTNLPGDKWSTKVVGSMGPGGDAVTEAARNYGIQKSLSPSEASKFTVNRSGLIEPNTKMPSTPVQRTDIMGQLAEAERKALESARELAKHQGILESMQKRGAVTPQQAAQVSSEKIKADKAATRLAELEKIAKGSMLQRFAGKLPGVLGGVTAGYELAEAANAIKRGDYKGAILPGMSGAGAALSLIPTVPTKLIGAGLAIPPLAYQAYQAMSEPDAPRAAPLPALPPSQ